MGSVMIKPRSQLLCFCFLLSDLGLTACAWLASYYLRFESGWLAGDKTPPEFFLCWRQLPLVLLLSATAYRLAGQYDVDRLRRFREEVVAVVKGTGLLTLLVLSTLFFLHDPYDTRATLLLFSGLTAGSVLLGRRLSWALLRTLRTRGYNQKYA